MLHIIYTVYIHTLHCCYNHIHIVYLWLEDVKVPYLGEVGSEEFLMKLTSQITEMVSAKITQGEEQLCVMLSV